MTPLATIAEYYGRIDRDDVAWVMSLFAEDAVYVRADSRYKGKPRIDRFFRSERKIKGRHEIDRIDAVGNRVFAGGEFIGEGAAGDDRRKRCH